MQKIFLGTSITPGKRHIRYIDNSKKNVSFSSIKSIKLFTLGLAYAHSEPLLLYFHTLRLYACDNFI